MACSFVVYWVAVKCLICYLNGTIHHGLTFFRFSPLQLVAFYDANWISSVDDRWSIRAYYVFLDYNLISWPTFKQRVVSRLSLELEYRAMVGATVELLWLRLLFSKLHLSIALVLYTWLDLTKSTLSWICFI